VFFGKVLTNKEASALMETIVWKNPLMEYSAPYDAALSSAGVPSNHRPFYHL
jgi:hypothetical protein